MPVAQDESHQAIMLTPVPLRSVATTPHHVAPQVRMLAYPLLELMCEAEATAVPPNAIAAIMVVATAVACKRRRPFLEMREMREFGMVVLSLRVCVTTGVTQMARHSNDHGVESFG